MLIDELTLINRQLTTTNERLSALATQARDAKENQREADERVADQMASFRAAQNARTNALNTKGHADDALAYARSVDKQPLLVAVSEAEAELTAAKEARASAYEALERAQSELGAAERLVKQAHNQFERVPERPKEEDFRVSREITEVIPGSGGSGQDSQSDGSSTGAIVGAVLAVLAVVGVAVAAWPQIAKALNL